MSAAMDAQRGDVVAQRFCRNAAGWIEPAGPQELLAMDAWLAGLTPGTAAAGPVLEKLSDRLPEGVSAVDARYWHPRPPAWPGWPPGCMPRAAATTSGRRAPLFPPQRRGGKDRDEG